MQKTTLCAPQGMSYPLNMYISMTCALPVVHPAVLAWRGSWLASGVAPMGGNPRLLFTDTPSDFSLEYSSGYTLSHTSDIPNALPEVLLRLLLLEVSYKRNTFKGLLIKASSLVAISCSIADHHTYTLYTIDSLLLSSGWCHYL